MQDRFGDGYTILRLGESEADSAPLAQAIASYGAPVTLLDIDEDRPRDLRL